MAASTCDGSMAPLAHDDAAEAHDAGLVEQAQQRLALDAVEARGEHEPATWSRGGAPGLDHAGRRRRRRPSASRSRRRRTRADRRRPAVGDRGPQRRRPGRRCRRRCGCRCGARAPGRRRSSRGVSRTPLADDERADALGAAELVAADRHQVGPGGQRRPRRATANAWTASVCTTAPRRPVPDHADDLGQRLDRADLVVGQHHRHERDVGAERRRPARRGRPRPSASTRHGAPARARSTGVRARRGARRPCTPPRRRRRATPRTARLSASVPPPVNTTSPGSQPERVGHDVAGLVERLPGGAGHGVGPDGLPKRSVSTAAWPRPPPAASAWWRRGRGRSATALAGYGLGRRRWPPAGRRRGGTAPAAAAARRRAAPAARPGPTRRRPRTRRCRRAAGAERRLVGGGHAGEEHLGRHHGRRGVAHAGGHGVGQVGRPGAAAHGAAAATAPAAGTTAPRRTRRRVRPADVERGGVGLAARRAAGTARDRRRPAPLRSRSTSVPAARSPRRWLSRVSSTEITAAAPGREPEVDEPERRPGWRRGGTGRRALGGDHPQARAPPCPACGPATASRRRSGSRRARRNEQQEQHDDRHVAVDAVGRRRQAEPSSRGSEHGRALDRAGRSAMASSREPSPAVSNSSTTASGVTMPRRVLAPRRSGTRRRHGTVRGGGHRPLPRPCNEPAWDRLGRADRPGPAGASAASAPVELDELVRLYQRTSTHLSYARTYYRDPALTARLTGLVAAAGAVVYGTRPRTLRAVGRFFTATFPAAVWHGRRFVPVSAVLPARARARPRRLAGQLRPRRSRPPRPTAVREAYVEEDFEDYYSSEPAAAVRHRGVHQQHPGGDPRLRRRDPALRRRPRCILVVNGANLGRGRRAVRRRRRAAQVLRADPPPRPARADRRGRRRRRRPAPRAGRSSPPATGPGATRWPRRAGGRS